MSTFPTVQFASVVHGAGGVQVDDPAEAFHEASRLYPGIAPGRLASMLALQASDPLRQTVARSSRTHDHRPGIDLPRVPLPRARLDRTLRRRGSRAPGGGSRLTLRHLGCILGAAYGEKPGSPNRCVPSGGALYPLELYVLALDLEAAVPSTFHYNPFRHRLEQLGSVDPADARAAVVEPTLLNHASALVVVTGMFWRSRFKYGLRGYRFALLEAGHAMQNALLTAAALGIDALPLGGFYDARLDALVGADGLDEAAVYALVLGGSR